MSDRIRFSAAVVGLGRIGQGYDYDCQDGSVIMTHASGFALHDGYELLAGVDPDPRQRQRFEAKFAQPAYPDVAALMSRHQPDVVSIGIPTDRHFAGFREVLDGDPRAILCEKPIAASLDDARQMVSLAEKRGCVLAVNYQRRFEPGVHALKRAIENGELGEIDKGVVWYSKGILNTASHYVDLLHFLLGDSDGNGISDEGPEPTCADPEPDVWLQFGRCRVFFLADHGDFFRSGEMMLTATKAVIRYLEGGAVIEIRAAEPVAAERGPSVAPGKPWLIPTDSSRCQWHVLDGLYRHLTQGRPLSSAGTTATATLAVIEEIRQRLRRRTSE